mmetsp:Transcript_86135/g.248649  ORF Transcript_86135/g.248649 Transcript_86135/m.248649 type:complete len:531 (-) Transcript_86135:598-2190(-)
MIQYRTGKWGICFAFSIKGSVFPKALVFALPCALLSMLLQALFKEYEVSDALSGVGDLGTSVLGGFTFVLGFLVVFRSQQAYVRWCEGATLLQSLRGEWFNAFSSCVAFCNPSVDKRPAVCEFEQQLVRLVSLLYGVSLLSLAEGAGRHFEFIELSGMDAEGLSYLRQVSDRSEVVLQWIQQLVVHAHRHGVLDVGPPILTRVFSQLGNGVTHLHNARKLNDFPIPFPLAQMITFMLIVHWVMTAFVVSMTVNTPAWAGLISFAVAMSFWGVHYIGEELEQPFGRDENDLPLQEMQCSLNDSLRELLDFRARYPPSFVVQPEMSMLMVLQSVELDSYIDRLASQEQVPCAKAVGTPTSRRLRTRVLPNARAREYGLAHSYGLLPENLPLELAPYQAQSQAEEEEPGRCDFDYGGSGGSKAGKSEVSPESVETEVGEDSTPPAAAADELHASSGKLKKGLSRSSSKLELIPSTVEVTQSHPTKTTKSSHKRQAVARSNSRSVAPDGLQSSRSRRFAEAGRQRSSSNLDARA